MHVVCQALQTGSAGDKVDSHLAVLSTNLTQLVVEHVSQALFNSDRLVFGMHMAYNLVPHLFQATEWALFLGNVVGERPSLLVLHHIACMRHHHSLRT